MAAWYATDQIFHIGRQQANQRFQNGLSQVNSTVWATRNRGSSFSSLTSDTVRQPAMFIWLLVQIPIPWSAGTEEREKLWRLRKAFIFRNRFDYVNARINFKAALVLLFWKLGCHFTSRSRFFRKLIKYLTRCNSVNVTCPRMGDQSQGMVLRGRRIPVGPSLTLAMGECWRFVSLKADRPSLYIEWATRQDMEGVMEDLGKEGVRNRSDGTYVTNQ